MKRRALVVVLMLVLGALAVPASPSVANHVPFGCIGPYIQATGGFGQYASYQVVFATGNTAFGGPGGDIIIGSHGSDLLVGGGGDDVICGSWGDDRIEGGPGNDQLFGNAGNDLLLGENDADHLDGGQGLDACFPGPGPDTNVRCELLNDVP